MSTSAQLEENYFNPITYQYCSGLLNELLAGTSANQNTISGFLQDLLSITPIATLSGYSQGTLPTLIIAKGVNLTSGQAVLFQSVDVLTDNLGNAYRSVTGIRGLTGLHGLTGLRGNQGNTGIIGNTGIQGITGITIVGYTGFQGLTGLVGITGVVGVIGSTGVVPPGMSGLRTADRITGPTGVIGITGNIGITGAAGRGVTGSQGASGIVGPTGIRGITGISPAGAGLQGDTGITLGATGLVGISGIRGPDGIITMESLSSTIQNTGNSASYILPGNTLDTNEQQLDILIWGSSASNGQNTILTLTFGGSTLLSHTFAGVFGAAFWLKTKIVRITSGSQENIAGLMYANGGLFAQRTATSIDLTVDQTIQISTNQSDAPVEVLLVRKVWQ